MNYSKSLILNWTFIIVCSLLLVSCKDFWQAIANFFDTDKEAICIIQIPWTVYSDDYNLIPKKSEQARFTRAVSQGFKAADDNVGKWIEFRNPSVSPPHSCGNVSAGVSGTMDYRQCMTDWSQLTVLEAGGASELCSFPNPAIFAGGAEVDRYTGEIMQVTPVLIDVKEGGGPSIPMFNSGITSSEKRGYRYLGDQVGRELYDAVKNELQ